MNHLVELFYSEHCLGCPEAQQVVRRFALERPDVTLVERDVAVAISLARHYRLIATPAIVIRPIWLLGGSVNQSLPSGPDVIPCS